MIRKIKESRHIKLILLGLIISIPVLVIPNIVVSHDILFHLTRIKAISNEISINSFPCLIYRNFIYNMGYASPLFYSDLFLYPFAFLSSFLSLVATYKILIITLNIVTVYVINYVLHKLFRNDSIIEFGTILYIFSSYRITDLYIRGSIGEVLAFIFVPLIILGIHELINGNKKNYYLIIGMTGIIYSHTITTYLIGIFLLFYLILNIKKLFLENRYLYLLKNVIIVFLLTCGYLLPLLEQLVDRRFYIHYLTTNVFNNISVPIWSLFLEIPIPSKVWIPLGIGIIYLIIIVLSIKYRNMLTKNMKIYLVLGISFLLCATDLLPNVIFNKFLLVIQFRWRFYFLATICLFMFTMYIFDILKKKEILLLKRLLLLSIVSLITITFTTSLLYTEKDTINKEYLGFYEYLPEGIKYDDIKDHKITSSCNNNINYKLTYSNNRYIIEYSNNNYENTMLTIPFLYYKGYVSNKDYDIINKNGMVTIKLNKVNDKIEVYYEGTTLTYISKIISFTTFIVIISIYIRKRSCDVKIK